MLRTCGREQDVLDLLRRGQWPAAGDPQLRAHVETCRSCAETVRVKSAFQDASAAARSEARLESPGLLWWRAQLRRRNEALVRMNRPVAGAQRFALAINLAVAVALVVWLARQTDLWQSWLAAIQSGSQSWLAALAQGGNLLLLLACVGVVALLGGVAVYLATERQ